MDAKIDTIQDLANELDKEMEKAMAVNEISNKLLKKRLDAIEQAIMASVERCDKLMDNINVGDVGTGDIMLDHLTEACKMTLPTENQ